MAKRDIDTLLLKYSLEPDCRDLYVEGSTDKAVFDWCVKENILSSFDIYDIDSVNFDSIDSSINFKGNREKVIELTTIVNSKISGMLDPLRGLIDADFDIILNNYIVNRFILYTDYANLDMYCFRESILDNLFSAYLRINFNHLIFLNICEVMQELFVLRLNCMQSNPPIKFITPARSCTLNGDLISFNRLNYIGKLLHRRQNSPEVLNFSNEVDERCALLTEDPRNQIHSHDLINILSWYARKMNVERTLYNETAISRALWLKLDCNDIMNEDMFTNLEMWAST